MSDLIARKRFLSLLRVLLFLDLISGTEVGKMAVRQLEI